MGVSSSNSQRPAQRRPSIHSGKLYRCPPDQSGSHQSLPIPSVHVHTAFTSEDFDKSNLELKENLPQDLKPYCNAIEIVYRFWCAEIETLSEDDYKQTAVLFYMNVFQLLPEVRALFGKKIEKQAQHFWGMTRWLIMNLRDSNPDRLINRIKTLGVLHQRMGIKQEWYDAMLQALHETLAETVKEKYTSRVRFCWTQLYTVVSNIMMGHEWDSLSSAKIANLVKSLNSLEATLENEEASAYLECFMKRQFCVELLMFYKEYRRFKACKSDIERMRIGTKMMTRFFGSSAECQINIGFTELDNLYRALQENNHLFSDDIFDEVCIEVIAMIRNNIWYDFRRSIMRVAVDADIRYDEIQASKSNLQLKVSTNTPTDVPSLTDSVSSPAVSPRAYLQVPSFNDNHSASTSTSSFASNSSMSAHSISNLLKSVPSFQ